MRQLIILQLLFRTISPIETLSSNNLCCFSVAAVSVPRFLHYSLGMWLAFTHMEINEVMCSTGNSIIADTLKLIATVQNMMDKTATHPIVLL
jgi:hypothetical protein